VLGDDAYGGQPLGARCADVVLRHHLDDAVADQAREAAGDEQAEGDARQYERIETATEHGDPAQLGGKDLDQDHADPEAWQRQSGEREHHACGVDPSIGSDAGDDAECAAEQQANDEAADGEPQREWELVCDQTDHRLLVAEAIAEITARGFYEEADVLHDEWPIQAELGTRCVHGGVADGGSLQHQKDWIARGESHRAEHDSPGDEQRQDSTEQA
jgi:hypothetical protein